MKQTSEPIKFFGKFRAIVADNDDPKKGMRVRMVIPEVLGETEISKWAYPVLAFGGALDLGLAGQESGGEDSTRGSSSNSGPLSNSGFTHFGLNETSFGSASSSSSILRTQGFSLSNTSVLNSS